MKKESEDIVGPGADGETRVIGFTMPSEEECCEEEEDC
jgi:hypothetical protein